MGRREEGEKGRGKREKEGKGEERERRRGERKGGRGGREGGEEREKIRFMAAEWGPSGDFFRFRRRSAGFQVKFEVKSTFQPG